jgi:hypothetical protein
MFLHFGHGVIYTAKQGIGPARRLLRQNDAQPRLERASYGIEVLGWLGSSDAERRNTLSGEALLACLLLDGKSPQFANQPDPKRLVFPSPQKRLSH